MGIGRATAAMLAAEGAQVAVTDIDEEAGRETVDRIVERGGEAVFFPHDVTSEADWKRVVSALQDTYGTPDVLVNNAGIYHIEPLAEMSADDWKGLMDVNVTGVFSRHETLHPANGRERPGLCDQSFVRCRACGPLQSHLLRSEQGGGPNDDEGAAMELVSAGIRVNSIHPAYIDTQMAEYGADVQGATKEELDAMHPIGHDVAYAALYLASEESKFMTGSELVIDGGFTA